MKLSFSLNAKPSSRPPRPPPPPSATGDGDSATTAASQPKFVTVFDPTQPVSAEPKLVIPPIPNADYLQISNKKLKLSLPSADEDPSNFCTETKFVLDTNGSSDPSSLPYGLSVRANLDKKDQKENDLDEKEKRQENEREGDWVLRRFKDDMKNLPDDRGMDEFREVSVDGFGAALLAGYGWSEGKGIGRNNTKGDTNIVEYNKRGGTHGLGFNPSSSDPKKLRSGEWSLPSNNKNTAKDKERESVSRTGIDDKERIERERESLSTRREDKDRERESGHTRRREGQEETERESGHTRRREDKEEKERESGTRKRENKETIRWLRSNIRVRVINKDLKKGRFYLKKGEVVDVVGPTTCDICMDGTHELVQGVEQDMLETALPKRGGAVVVLYGKYKGIFGNLVEKDLDEETGVVRDSDSHSLISVKLGQVAEYLGDPALLDY